MPFPLGAFIGAKRRWKRWYGKFRARFQTIMDYCKEFEDRLLPVDFKYTDREDRNRFASGWISRIILPEGGKILNIGGGGKRHLQSKLGASYEVFEIDLVGDCDLIFDLDSGPLPLEGRAFDLSCAFDVLEHLENFHSVLDEMLRISSGGVLLSLPVATREAIWNNFLYLVDRANPYESGVRNKFYGLPLSPPADRHRWWLSFADIIRYFVNFEKTRGVVIKFAVPSSSIGGWKKKVLKRMMGRDRFYELFVPVVWVHIARE